MGHSTPPSGIHSFWGPGCFRFDFVTFAALSFVPRAFAPAAAGAVRPFGCLQSDDGRLMSRGSTAWTALTEDAIFLLIPIWSLRRRSLCVGELDGSCCCPRCAADSEQSYS